jgi:hypothetical protein
MRYYKPTPTELLNTKNLVLEMYDEEEKSWTVFTYDCTKHMGILLDDLRVKYLDSLDFNELGHTCKKVFLGKQTIIVDIIEHADKEDEEVTEERDVFSEEVLIVLKRGLPVGKFFPYLPEQNVVIEGKTHSIKNLSELRKILNL